MDAFNYKTVFVIDHSPYFGISCEDPMEFELSKSRTMNVIPPRPISKSLWTSSLESAIEYCRIVWDLFPVGKLVRFIASDTVGHDFNDWTSEQQNITQILTGSADLGAPPRSHSQNEYSVIHGLRSAIDALTECTEDQNRNRDINDGTPKIANNCRVICITSTRDNDSMHSLQEIFLKCLIAQNKTTIGSEGLIPVRFCHLVVINIYPNNGDTMVTNQATTDVSPVLRTEVHSVRAGKFLSEKLSNLILGHYDLASTTVTGIPMKEEQNASSSANYDVEIFHHSGAHSEVSKADMTDVMGGKSRKTMTLKWCTPRGNSQELYPCSAAHRITPVDVNSRPSSCLINFLLSGRSVMLEMPRRGGGKTLSHLLSSHGGDIYIHALSTGRSVLEDPPSISEGCGGRVTDYRVSDFGAFIKNNKLVPLQSRIKEIEHLGMPLKRMKNRIGRLTKYWPITISGTFIFNIRQLIDPLPQLMAKEELTEDEVVSCRQVIYNLVASETKHESLIQPASGARGKVAKREEQYRIMWNELEKLVRLHCRTENHSKVLYSLLELRSVDPEKSEKVELDQALRELDVLTPEIPTIDFPVSRASVIRATTDSPMSPPPATIATPHVLSNTRQHRISANSSIYSGPKTVLDIYKSKINAENKMFREKRSDFFGRQNATELKADLYPNLVKNDIDRSRDDQIVE